MFFSSQRLKLGHRTCAVCTFDTYLHTKRRSANEKTALYTIGNLRGQCEHSGKKHREISSVLIADWSITQYNLFIATTLLVYRGKIPFVWYTTVHGYYIVTCYIMTAKLTSFILQMHCFHAFSHVIV